MILTTKARYAVMALIEIAGEKGAKSVSLAKISKSQEISMFYLEQIFRKLKKAGIVDANKGSGGGYFLARSAKQITIADIVIAVNESLKMTRCNSKNEKTGCMSNKSRCKAHHLWRGLENNIVNYLQSISLADL